MHTTFQPVVLAIVKRGGKYLLTRRNDSDNFHNMWQLPGGGVEFGEKLEDALLRECREEIGVEVMIDATLPHIESQVQGSWQGVFICYVCHMANPDSDIILNEEASEFGWYTYAEIRNLTLMPLLDRIFAAAIENNI